MRIKKRSTKKENEIRDDCEKERRISNLKEIIHKLEKENYELKMKLKEILKRNAYLNTELMKLKEKGKKQATKVRKVV